MPLEGCVPCDDAFSWYPIFSFYIICFFVNLIVNTVFISKFKVGLKKNKKFLRQGISEPLFYGGVVYKLYEFVQ